MNLRFLIWIVAMAPSIALGHLMEVGHGAINLVAEKVYLAMAIPSSAFSSSDDNGVSVFKWFETGGLVS